MPSAQMTTGSEKYTDFEEKRYILRSLSCKATTSPPPDSREQFEWLMALEGTEDPESGREIAVKMWTSAIWGEAAGKESHLVLVMRAFKGASVTLADFEALDYDDLAGLRASAMVKLNAKGYPTIDKETIKPAGGAAPRNQAALPEAAPTPAAPKRPAPPARPAANVASAEQRNKLGELSVRNGMSAEELDAWVAESYPGKTFQTISPEEADALIEALNLPF